MDSSAMATRRMHMFVTLAAGSTIMFMAGVGMVLIGEAMQLEKPAGWQQLVTLGLVLAGCGLAGGVVSAARWARQAGRRGGLASGSAGASGLVGAARAAGAPGAGPAVGNPAVGNPAVGSPAVTDPAEDWLSPFRGGGLRPVSNSVRAAAVARAAQAATAGPGARGTTAGHPDGPSAAQYSDEGWHLAGAEPAQPGPAQHRRVQAPAQPSPEIRPPAPPPMSPEPGRWPGSGAGQPAAYDRGPEPAPYTGQFPAYDEPAYHTGQFPAYDEPAYDEPAYDEPAYHTGQFPAYDPGSELTYGSGPESAYDPGPELAHDSGPRRNQGYDPGPEPAHDTGHLPAYLPAPAADAGDLADQRPGQG